MLSVVLGPGPALPSSPVLTKPSSSTHPPSPSSLSPPVLSPSPSPEPEPAKFSLSHRHHPKLQLRHVLMGYCVMACREGALRSDLVELCHGYGSFAVRQGWMDIDGNGCCRCLVVLLLLGSSVQTRPAALQIAATCWKPPPMF